MIDPQHLKQEIVSRWGTHLNRDRLKVIRKFAGFRVLDVGCGGGIYVKYLSQRGYEIKGVDLTLPSGLSRDSRFVKGDIRNLPFKENSFDTVIAFEVLEHLDDVGLKRAINELRRITKHNVIISVPNCQNEDVFRKSRITSHHYIDRTHCQEFTESSLCYFLEKNGFTVNLIAYTGLIKPETLFLEGWFLPLKVANFVGEIATKIPKKKHYTTIIVVASITSSKKRG